MNLSTGLRANAAFTMICATTCLAATDWVTAHTALPGRPWTIALGIMLATYVPILLFAAARQMDWLVKTIIALDWGFVAIAAIFLAMSWSKVDATGAALIAVPALSVALFALLQAQGWTQSQREARA